MNKYLYSLWLLLQIIMHRNGYVVVSFIKILTTKTIYHIILICVIYYCMTEKVETLEETIENNFNKIINDN